MPRVDERLLHFARQLRREMTPAEARLWYHLRAKRLGYKFVRQSVRRPYIADFLARSHKLVIEIDGDTHAHTSQYDARRTVKLERDGYRVLHFTNGEVMDNEEGVLTTILDVLASSSSPLWGEGRGEGAVAQRPREPSARPLSLPPLRGSLPPPKVGREK